MATTAARRRQPVTSPYWVDAFLSQSTCERLLQELEFAFWKPSVVVSRTANGVVSHQSQRRVSQSTSEQWFTSTALRTLQSINKRIAALLKVPTSRFEEWQVVRYRCGGKFDYHLDAGLWSSEPAGERVWTAMIYLDTPLAGGATQFKMLHISVPAVSGRLLVWKNLLSDGTPDPWMLHRGSPVRRGQKTILVTWIRERRARP